ncbi:hypothetical protein CAPTEDRAFT_220800 [Capitella teleta]|uniref:CARD domain-containing protein n=1 Tax=Capitella teleta TaxID=283909 RepID=R7U8Z2_CAPTE|nr:hypothetical protein CAPTEDRAFT_220800 [Capitella teleta]|eukprot:ELU00167.1 hypothetical protein CAPTEDRAFT_220800 [Capitella teleta]
MMSSNAADSAPTTSAGSSDDVLMTRAHKQHLSQHRDSLVENMYPDDVLNRLQSRKVLTARDVTRIKEKGGIDSQNETLLDVLLRKPDRAFEELVSSLRETDQDHVANIISPRDPPPQGRPPAASGVSTTDRVPPQRLNFSGEEEEEEEVYDRRRGRSGLRARSGSRPRRGLTPGSRRRDAVRVRLQAEVGDEDVGRTPRSASRADYQSREDELTSQINDEILETSLIELQNLRDVAETGVTTQTISARKGILKTLAQLQKFRRDILGIGDGSVVFYVACPSVEALDDLWHLCKSGKLAGMFQNAIVTRSFLRRHKVMKVSLSVGIHPEEYSACREFIQSKAGTRNEVKLQRSSSLKENEGVQVPVKSGSEMHCPLLEQMRTPDISEEGWLRSSSGVSSVGSSFDDDLLSTDSFSLSPLNASA